MVRWAGHFCRSYRSPLDAMKPRVSSKSTPATPPMQASNIRYVVDRKERGWVVKGTGWGAAGACRACGWGECSGFAWVHLINHHARVHGRVRRLAHMQHQPLQLQLQMHVRLVAPKPCIEWSSPANCNDRFNMSAADAPLSSWVSLVTRPA